jgi:hypothetical protein
VGSNAGDAIVWLLTLLLLGALAVLVIMNPGGFSKSAGTVFKGFGSWATTLSGSNYGKK